MKLRVAVLAFFCVVASSQIFPHVFNHNLFACKDTTIKQNNNHISFQSYNYHSAFCMAKRRKTAFHAILPSSKQGINANLFQLFVQKHKKLVSLRAFIAQTIDNRQHL